MKQVDLSQSVSMIKPSELETQMYFGVFSEIDGGVKWMLVHDSNNDNLLNFIDSEGLICDKMYCGLTIEKVVEQVIEDGEELFQFDSFKELLKWMAS